MNDKDLLAKKNEELQNGNEELQTRVDELEADIAKLPTEEEFASLQRDNTDIQSQLDSADLDELKKLAQQGEAYLDIVRTEAKDAFKTKLMSDGVKKTEVEEHPEYLAHCRDVDEIDDIKTLYRSAQSDYRSARSNRKAGRVSKELNDYTRATEGDNTHFVGGNDIR